ncbi:NGDN protein, partial [Poecile atricapillus]|nr:NGDN protein [Poecile atricapillus]
VLEKLRPLEQRLKYHLEKLLRAAASGGRGHGRVPQDEEEEEEEEQGQGGGAKAPGLGGGRRYVPPRLVPVSCDPAPDPESRSRSRLRLRALNSAALRELRQELGEGPLEEGEGLQPPHREEIQRRRWEESMLQRLSAPCRRRRGAGLGLDDVTNFGAFPALLGANQVRGGRGLGGEMAGKGKMGGKKGKNGKKNEK